METTIIGYTGYRIWNIWESYCNLPEAIFYLLKGDYTNLNPITVLTRPRRRIMGEGVGVRPQPDKVLQNTWRAVGFMSLCGVNTRSGAALAAVY